MHSMHCNEEPNWHHFYFYCFWWKILGWNSPFFRMWYQYSWCVPFFPSVIQTIKTSIQTIQRNERQYWIMHSFFCFKEMYAVRKLLWIYALLYHLLQMHREFVHVNNMCSLRTAILKRGFWFFHTRKINKMHTWNYVWKCLL